MKPEEGETPFRGTERQPKQTARSRRARRRQFGIFPPGPNPLEVATIPGEPAETQTLFGHAL